jgi:hypothetical protein
MSTVFSLMSTRRFREEVPDKKSQRKQKVRNKDMTTRR